MESSVATMTQVPGGVCLIEDRGLPRPTPFVCQPESFSSIPASMWWTVMTLTTVGYGDIYPITPFGKLLGAMIALIGIGLFALPAGVLAAGFAEQLTQQRKGKVIRTCPHCSKELT
ncbi:MAG TPA: potassium channel family protein [Vicinamibacterales bacterium]|nr:potassium channel family protein [Vicinamibacterales bacterium]